MSLYKNDELVGNNPPVTSIIDNENILWKLGTPPHGLFAKIQNLQIDGISNQSFNVDYPITVGVGNILYDYSGNQNHGTIVGATLEEVVFVSTDLHASNYNPDATTDDGSCSGYPDNGNFCS